MSTARSMESSIPRDDEPSRPGAGRPEWRSLGQLRDRVEDAVREIERLRSENAALAKRLLELQAGADAPSFAFGEGEDTEALRARVQGFLDVVDGLLGDDTATTATEDAA